MFDDQKFLLEKIFLEIASLKKTANIQEKHKLLKDLESKISDPTVYQDFVAFTKFNRQKKALEESLSAWSDLEDQKEELEILLEISTLESMEESLAKMNLRFAKLQNKLQEVQTFTMFGEKPDICNSYLTVKPGAGGTESCDWALCLLRMYTRWAEQKGFVVNTIDYQSGEEAGIKSATLLIEGSYAQGYLKGENGVHRLVRISPFDSQKRRHTSFCSVYVIPEVVEEEVSLDMSDVRVDTHRSSGAGGQHVNTTNSAVRLTHIPTGIVVNCQAERSQVQNKEKAIKVLKSRLEQYHKEDREKKLQGNSPEKKKIEWGSQIRSYVFHPYTMVKDHRTLQETSNVQSVLDGELDLFMRAFLREFYAN